MSDTIVMPLLAEASHRLALAQHLAKADVAEEGVEFAAAALNRLQADTRLAKHVSDAGIWVAELSEDLPDALRWDRSLEARCGLLATELGELAALIKSPTKAAKPRCQHHPRIHVPDGLRTMREAAARLGCSVKTLKAHIASGALGYVVIGHGSKRPRKMFTDADINRIHRQSDPQGRSRMSVFPDKRSPYYQYDFQLRGHRFHGSTKATTKREAEKVEAVEREKAKAQIAQIETARTSLRLDDVAGRYWTEHAQHLAEAATAWGRLRLLIQFFGKDKLITDINGDDVAKLVAWRRGHPKRNHGPGLVSPFTVNATVEQLRKLFTALQAVGRPVRSRAGVAQVFPASAAGARARAKRRRGRAPGAAYPCRLRADLRLCPSDGTAAVRMPAEVGRGGLESENDPQARQGRQVGNDSHHIDRAGNPVAAAGASSGLRVHLCAAAEPW